MIIEGKRGGFAIGYNTRILQLQYNHGEIVLMHFSLFTMSPGIECEHTRKEKGQSASRKGNAKPPTKSCN
jgi:hypothetical protein